VISLVRGRVLAIELNHAVIEVGGIGVVVHATPTTLARLRAGEQALLHTTLVVREDSLTLFGFADVDARELFVLLQTATGIGPRLALAALAVLEPDKLRAALAEGNITMLTRVPGIGRKGAERLSLDLRDKVDATSAASMKGAVAATTAGKVHDEVVAALLSLGFDVKRAERTVDGILGTGSGNGDGAANTSSVLRAALSVLGSNARRPHAR
jgi:Holliday junction DNA helicase RuvA